VLLVAVVTALVWRGEGDLRLKGGRPQLLVYVRAAAGPRPLADGAAVHPGDVVQLAYVASGFHYGAIASIDDRGHAALHFPSEATGSTALRDDGEVRLPYAFQLDGDGSEERFFLVVSADPLDAHAVLAAAELAARAGQDRLPLPAGVTQVRVVLRKVPVDGGPDAGVKSDEGGKP
jgi:hypothetical protein